MNQKDTVLFEDYYYIMHKSYMIYGERYWAAIVIGKW